MKRLVVVLMALGFLFVAGKALFADDSAQKPDAVTGASVVKAKAVDVGNKTCPVAGGPVGASKVTAEYKGKIYHLCCADCLKAFKKDPKKYAAIADKEVSTAKPAAK